ncbi:hypothetical protein B9Z55_007245 [Caenorhabditis nigoni]|uniref:BRCT domain-containing protein n=1 Tax=Caenorhabditis nigoni TaxID=1611254 RepID=A0A2G5V8W8_9PELO|nr:hypothetical protein B9Z55_007245 [Caenorhabditis nigoni]
MCWKMLIMYLIIGILLAPKFLSAQGQAKSDLELLTDDFQIFARVTNAIYLQASAIRKDIKAHDVIVEFLKISSMDFENIIAIDAKRAMSHLESLYADVQEFSERYDDQDEKIFEDNSKKLRNFSYNFPVVGRLVEDKIVTNVEILKAVKGLIEIMDQFEKNCSSKIVEKATEVLERYTVEERNKWDKKKDDKNKDEEDENDENDRKRRNADTVISNATLKGIKSLSTSFKEFEPCFKAIKDLNATLKASLMYSTGWRYEWTIGLIENFSGELENLTKILADFEPWLRESHSFLSQLRSYTIGDQISQTVNYHKSHSEILDPPIQGLTVAFLEPKDMIKVADDLKSTFFKNQVSRGSDVMDLNKALGSFHRIAKAIQPLIASWKAIEKLDEEAVEDYAAVFQNLLRLENFASNHSVNALEYLKVVNGSIQKCLEKPSKDYSKIAQKFENQQSKAKAVMKQFREFIQMLNEKFFGGLLDPDSGKLPSEECLRETLNDGFKELKEKNQQLEIGNANEVWSRMNSDYKDCLEKKIHSTSIGSTLNLFSSLNLARKALTESLEEFYNHQKSNKLDVELKKVLIESRRPESLKCLQKDISEEMIKTLWKTNAFFREVFYVPDEETVQSLIRYLGLIDQVKTNLTLIDDQVRQVGKRPKRATAPTDLVLALNGSKLHSENLGISVRALLDLVKVRANRDKLLAIKFNGEARDLMEEKGDLSSFREPQVELRKLLKEADSINEMAKELRRNKTVVQMAGIFEKVSPIHGIYGNRQKLWELSKDDKTDDPKYGSAREHWKTLVDLNLNFQRYSARVKDGQFTVNAVMKYFDKIFGHVNEQKANTVVVNQSHLSWLFIFCIAIGVVLLLLITCLVLYGFTEKGKLKYKNLWLYYFGKPIDFESRWRYSLFMDMENGGKNALLDAVRETNKTNMLNALKRGVYVNAYNKYGNTALHVAARRGHWELAEILIKYGADRSLLNYKNRTAEQYIPTNFKHSQREMEKEVKDKTELYKKVEEIFKKYEKKSFRMSVPEVFPTSSFHIWIEERTDDDVTEKFMAQFQSISSYEIMSTTTHCIVKCDENGVLETENFDILSMILNGAIMVQDKWMTACLKDHKEIGHDSKYLVKKVKFNGVIYATVLEWSMAMAKSEMPYLCGVYVAVVMREYKNLISLAALVTNHGAVMMSEFPDKEKFNEGSRPYLHSHLGPLFLINDGETDLSAYKNDKMYTLFTEYEFLAFMLKRNIKRDRSKNPMDGMKNDF